MVGVSRLKMDLKSLAHEQDKLDKNKKKKQWALNCERHMKEHPDW